MFRPLTSDEGTTLTLLSIAVCTTTQTRTLFTLASILRCSDPYVEALLAFWNNLSAWLVSVVGIRLCRSVNIIYNMLVRNYNICVHNYNIWKL